MSAPAPFSEAIANLESKGLLPTNLGSAELRQLDAAIRRQSIFSARTLSEYYLGKIKDTVESIINSKQVEREGNDQTVTEGFNPATARQELRSVLQSLGYAPAAGEEGTIKDLASDGRLQLVVNTNTQLAQGAGAFIKSNDPDVVDEYPAWELVRFEDREHPRNWDGGGEEKKGSPFGTRWMLAAQEAGDTDAARILDETGRMVALKSSDIWQALGDGAGGFDDTLGNPFPPFAFNSGMWTQDVSHKAAEQLGLLDPGDDAAPHPLDLTKLFTES